MNLQRKTPLRRGNPLESRGRVNRSNAKRTAKAYARNFGDEADMVRAMPCLCAHQTLGEWACRGPVQAAHVTARGMGAVKGGRFDLVPLCAHHHVEAGEANTSQRADFEKCYGFDLRAEADRIAVEHAAPLGLRSVGQRWTPVVERQCGECSAPASCRGADGEPMCVEHGEPLGEYERAALFGWVRRTIDRERGVYAAPMVIAQRLCGPFLPIENGLARLLCEAAGWETPR